MIANHATGSLAGAYQVLAIHPGFVTLRDALGADGPAADLAAWWAADGLVPLTHSPPPGIPGWLGGGA